MKTRWDWDRPEDGWPGYDLRNEPWAGDRKIDLVVFWVSVLMLSSLVAAIFLQAT